MTSKKNWSVDYKSQEGDSVYMGNNQDCEIIGVGLVLLKLFDNREVLLKGVRHVPKLKRNLVSLGMLDDLGCFIYIERGLMKVKRQGKVVLTSRKVEGLYTVKNVIKP